MRVLANRRGFSLVELLTVIAIIAILAAIIFPVMGLVKNKANMTACITQLHEVGLAVQAFKSDNRRYPDMLGAQVQYRGTPAVVVPFGQVARAATGGPAGLVPEYITAARMLHCKMFKYVDDKIVVSGVYNPAGTGVIEAYASNSYDFMIYGELPGGAGASDFRQHYARSWAASVADVPGVAATDPASPPEKTSDDATDYERQLKFRTPPGNTIVTWCSWHETYTGLKDTLQVSSRAPVLYLDGHTDTMEGGDIERYKYRLLPKKE